MQQCVLKCMLHGFVQNIFKVVSKTFGVTKIFTEIRNSFNEELTLNYAGVKSNHIYWSSKQLKLVKMTNVIV